MATKTKLNRINIRRNYLYKRRHELNMSQAAVAYAMGMEISTYNQIENGKLGNLMNTFWLSRLSKALKVPIDYLVESECYYFVKYCEVNKIERS